MNNVVICDDALEFVKRLEDNCVDLVVTSPPYNKKGKNHGALVSKVVYDNYDDNMDEKQYRLWQVEVLNELYRVVKEDGWVFYNHKVRYEAGKMLHPVEWLIQTKWTIWQELIWDRRIAGNIRGWRFWNIDERIYWLVKQKPSELPSHFASLSSILRIPVEREHKEHPAPFPVELPALFIKLMQQYKKDIIVLDPFCGIGTTAVAAQVLGAKYLCCDISKSYVEYTKERLGNLDREIEKINAFLSNMKLTKKYFEKNESLF